MSFGGGGLDGYMNGWLDFRSSSYCKYTTIYISVLAKPQAGGERAGRKSLPSRSAAKMALSDVHQSNAATEEIMTALTKRANGEARRVTVQRAVGSA